MCLNLLRACPVWLWPLKDSETLRDGSTWAASICRAVLATKTDLSAIDPISGVLPWFNARQGPGCVRFDMLMAALLLSDPDMCVQIRARPTAEFTACMACMGHACATGPTLCCA